MNWNLSKGKSCCVLASEKQNQPCPGGLKKAKRLGSRPCVRNKPRTRACRELPGALLPASSGSGSSLLTTTLISLDLIPFYFLFWIYPPGLVTFCSAHHEGFIFHLFAEILELKQMWEDGIWAKTPKSRHRKFTLPEVCPSSWIPRNGDAQGDRDAGSALVHCGSSESGPRGSPVATICQALAVGGRHGAIFNGTLAEQSGYAFGLAKWPIVITA